MASKKGENTATAFLLLGVFFWGATFVLVKLAVERLDVFSFLAIRFSISALLLAAIFYKSLKGVTFETIWKGLVIGTALAMSFIFQTIGLKYTSIYNSAFITGLYIVVVPVSVIVLDRRLPSLMQTLSIATAFAGLGLITIKPGFSIGAGDTWTLLCALAFGVHVVMIGRMVRTLDARPFTIIQLATVAVISAAAAMVTQGHISFTRDYIAWRSIIFCAVFAGAFMYTVQAHFQRRISEIKAVIVYSMEPLFAAVIAYFWKSERLGVREVVGGALILFAMVFADMKLNAVKKASK